jgi:transposase
VLQCATPPGGPGAFPGRAVVSPAALLDVGDLLPHLKGLQVERVTCTDAGVFIDARTAPGKAACPACGVPSARVHSRYARKVEDGPAGGRPVVVRLVVRRLFCGNADCKAVTFAEQAEGLTARYRRRSVPLTGLLASIGLALAGRAGSRMAAALGVRVHRTTLLGLVAALPEPPAEAAPEVTGIDDFALRKGRVYGTVLVDVNTGRAVDLLPGREASAVEEWLAARPGARVICRDRAANYAEGALRGAPSAVQVADRWHLWHNLCEYAEKAVAAHRGCLAGPAAPGEGAVPPPAGPEGLRDVCGRERSLVARTRDRHAAVQGLLAAGHSQRDAAVVLGLSRGTVNRFAAAATADELLVKATTRPGKIDRYKPYLRRRWNEGVTSAAALHAELQAKGWTGSVQAVERYVRPFRAMSAAPPPGPVIPATRQITRWLLTRPDSLAPADQDQLADVLGRCPHLHALAGHVRAFASIMARRAGREELEAWLAAVEAGDLTQLRSFANGVRRDQEAVTNGLSLPWSSAKVEGTVTKIKMLKRQMYGRASFELLRKRVILHSG